MPVEKDLLEQELRAAKARIDTLEQELRAAKELPSNWEWTPIPHDEADEETAELWLWTTPEKPDIVRAAAETLASAPTALNPKKWLTLPLLEREDLTHDSRRYRFSLQSSDGEPQQLGLPTGQHVFIKAIVAGKPVIRAYTPLGHGLGFVDFVIKSYFPLPPHHPNGGALTMFMEQMQIGDTMQFKGPLGEFQFSSDAPTFTDGGKCPTRYSRLGFIAGGTGITPCLQVANALLEAQISVDIYFLVASKTPGDVLCKPELDTLAEHPHIRVWHTASSVSPADKWPFSAGRINEQLLREHLPPPGDDTFVFMCGPQPMIDEACTPSLQRLGHAEDRLHCF